MQSAGNLESDNCPKSTMHTKASATFANPFEGIINVFPRNKNNGMIHYILETDLSTVLTYWTCLDNPDPELHFVHSKEFMFMMSRSANPSQDIVNKIHFYVDKYYDSNFVEFIDQSNSSCPLR